MELLGKILLGITLLGLAYIIAAAIQLYVLSKRYENDDDE